MVERARLSWAMWCQCNSGSHGNKLHRNGGCRLEWDTETNRDRRLYHLVSAAKSEKRVSLP